MAGWARSRALVCTILPAPVNTPPPPPLQVPFIRAPAAQHTQALDTRPPARSNRRPRDIFNKYLHGKQEPSATHEKL